MSPSDAGGPSVLITGANGGLGRSLALRLASTGEYRTVVLAVRTEADGHALAAELGDRVPNATFPVLAVDVSSLASVDQAVRSLVTTLDTTLDGMVLCAGGTGGADPDATTSDGVNIVMATNIVGHVALVEGMHAAGLLTGTVEFVSSEAAVGVPALHLPTPEIATGSVDEFVSWIDGSYFAGKPFDRALAYGQSKLLGALWCGAYARKHADVRTVATSPGNTQGTGSLRDLPLPLRIVVPRINRIRHLSHPLSVGTERLALGLTDPRFGTGRFWASGAGKLTGPVVDQAELVPALRDLDIQNHAAEAISRFTRKTA